MGSIDDKLKYLSDTKVQLYNAFKSKGSDITNETPFRNYPTEVYKLAQGTYAPTISPVGLRVWVDAIENQGACSTTKFSGTATNWIPMVGINNGGIASTSKNLPDANPYWENDYIKLPKSDSYSYACGVYFSSPYSSSRGGISNITYNTDATLECTFSVRQYNNPDDSTISQIWGTTDSGGYSLRLTTDGSFLLAYYTNVKQTITFARADFGILPLNKRIYCCARIKEGKVSLFSTLDEQIHNFEISYPLYTLPDAALTMGYNGSTNGVYEGYKSYINVNSARYYTRYITDEEMMNNYLYDKSRFNVKVPKKLIINPNPSDATVLLTATGYTQEGNNISVLEGTEVTYSVSKEGYTTQTGTVVVSENQTLNITLNAPS